MEDKHKETTSAGGVVMNSKGEVLVVSQGGTSWSLPKGHVEVGEDSLKAAKREIYEESGIKKLNLIKEFPVYKRFRLQNGGDDVTELKTIIMFFFETQEMILKPIDKENPEARWVTKEEVAGLLTHPKDKEFFLSIRDKI